MSTRDPQSMSGQQAYPPDRGPCANPDTWCGHRETVHAFSEAGKHTWCSTYINGVKCGCRRYVPETREKADG